MIIDPYLQLGTYFIKKLNGMFDSWPERVEEKGLSWVDIFPEDILNGVHEMLSSSNQIPAKRKSNFAQE